MSRKWKQARHPQPITNHISISLPPCADALSVPQDNIQYIPSLYPGQCQCLFIASGKTTIYFFPTSPLYHRIICRLFLLSFTATTVSLFLVLPCPTSLFSSWMEDRLTWESNEARNTSTTHCLVTADAPLNPSTTNQRYYIINSVNRAGQWLQVQYCFHLTFSEVK